MDASSQNGIPEPFQARFRAYAAENESPVAWLQTDLNAELRYAAGLVVLTNQRLISFPTLNGNHSAPVTGPKSWPLADLTSLHVEEHSGLGSLRLLSGETSLARWRYTAAQSAAA